MSGPCTHQDNTRGFYHTSTTDVHWLVQLVELLEEIHLMVHYSVS